MKKFVICANCGARMRADRSWCLRCDEPLVAAVETPSTSAAARAGGSAEEPGRGRQFIVAAIGSLTLLVLGAVAWEMRPGQTAAPGGSSRTTAARPTTSESAASNSTEPMFPPGTAPGEFYDKTRAGTAAFLTGDMNAAKQQFEAALAQKPDDPEVLNSLGQVLDREGDIPGAIARFERAIQLAPNNWSYHFNLAHAVSRLSQWTRAVDEYREAARLFPDDYATQYNLANALHTLGNDAAAIPEYEKAIQLAPSEASFHIALGNSYQAVGRLFDARKAFETYLEMEPSAPDADKVKAHIETLIAAAAVPRAGAVR